jgi:exonuclease SbcC
MVLLRRLVAQNFKHLNVDVSFPEGILAISGPNESGKSSIFEAILFAFYGRTNKAPRGEKEQLINFDAESLLAQLNFELEGKQYRITRRLHKKRPSEAFLHLLSPGDGVELLATGVTNVDNELGSLLSGIDLSDMLASNIVLQKDLDHLAKLQKTDRRHVINAMMGRECFTRANEKVAEESRPLRKELDGAVQALDQLRQRAETYQRDVQELETKRQESQVVDQQLKEASQAHAQTEKRYTLVKAYKEAKDAQSRLQQDLKHQAALRKRQADELARLAKQKEQQSRLRRRQVRFKNLDKDLNAFQDARTTADELDNVTREQAVATAALNDFQKQLGKLDTFSKAAAEYDETRARRLAAEASQRRILSPMLYIPSIGFLAAGLVALLLNLPLGMILLLCSVPFLAYLAKTYVTYRRVAPQLAKLYARERELEERAGKYRSKDSLIEQLGQQRKRHKDLEAHARTAQETLRAELDALSPNAVDKAALLKAAGAPALLAVIRKAEEKIQRLKAERASLSEQLDQIEAQLKDAPQIEKEMADIEKEEARLSAQLDQFKLPNLPSDPSPYSEKMYDDLEQGRTRLGNEKARLQEAREGALRRIEELTTSLRQDEGVTEEYALKAEQVKTLQDTLAINESVSKVLNEAAERGREQVRPGVESVMGPLLTSITDGKYRFPQLSEDYTLKVYSAAAGQYVQASLFSGGTEDQFLLALRLGFAITLLPHGRGTAPQFLLLDEPFAGSDVQRRDNIIHLLQAELSKTFRQIIVVSHQRVILAASEHRLRMADGRIFQIE